MGELLIRFTPPGRRLVAQAGRLDLSVGGAEANVAIALASLGHGVRFCGIVSDNPLGDRAVAELRRAGVDATFLARASGRMGLYFLEEGAGPRPSAITYDRAGSAFALAVPSAIDFAGALEGAKVFHTGGITPALGPNGVELARAAQAAAKAAAVPICFDANYRGALWRVWECDPREVLGELVGDAAILFGNHRDISLLLDRKFRGDGPSRRREAAEAAFSAFPKLELIASTARQVVTSDQHRLAARIDTRDGAYQTEEMVVTGIVERIGTGDALAAGVIDGWLAGGDLARMAETGLAMSALKHTLPGDNAPISRAMVQSFSPEGGDVRR